MSIYAANNRMGRASDATVVANESYGANDIGRILYETQVNDQAIFEAVLASDFAEIQGLREGTLLESEVQALNEMTTKEFFTQMKDRLMKFWAKIKAVFKSAIAKMVYFLTGDASKFLKAFEKEYKYENYVAGAKEKGKEFKGRKHIDQAKLAEKVKAIPDAEFYKKAIAKAKDSDRMNKSELIAVALGKQLNATSGTVIAPKDYQQSVINNLATETKDVKKFVEFAKDALANNKGCIKGLKETQAAIEKKLGEVKAELTKAEKDLITKDSSKEDKKKSDLSVSNIATMVSAFETVTANIVNAYIRCYKLNIRTAYSGLNEILSIARKGVDKTVAESAPIVAEDEVDVALDTDIKDLPAETQSAIEAEVDAVEIDDAE